jgi:hypothetical protein
MDDARSCWSLIRLAGTSLQQRRRGKLAECGADLVPTAPAASFPLWLAD